MNVIRKPSTANTAGKKNNCMRVISASEHETNIDLKINKNQVYSKHHNQSNKKQKQSEKFLKSINEKSFKEEYKNSSNNNINSNNSKNNLLKIPILKDSFKNLNKTNNNLIGISNRKEKISNSPVLRSDNEDEINNNLLLIQDKNKLTYNPLLPNRNKFEKIYKQYKEQEKPDKDVKVLSESEIKFFYSNKENKTTNLKMINS